MANNKPTNKILKDLQTIGYGDKIKQFYNKTRDRKDIKILQCEKSGALFLNKTDHILDDYYETRENYYLDDELNDTERRAEIVNQYADKKYLDIGTGQGKILEHVECKEKDGLEPQTAQFKYRNISEVKCKYDTVSMFHVLEHVSEQIEYLKKVFSIMKSGGNLIIEVPNAKDALIETCEAFRKHTFWSEHLILHTEASLLELLLYVGFTDIQIMPVQRYNKANHEYWYKHGKPGGHNHIKCDALSEKKHKERLIKTRKTDTLLFIAKKP